MTLVARWGKGGPVPRSAARVPQLNLLPEPVRAATVTRRRTRLWVTATATLGALVAATWSVLQNDCSERATLTQMGSDAQVRIAAEQGRAAATAKEAARVAKRQAALAALERARSVAQDLAALSAALPEKAVVTSIKFSKAAGTPRTASARSESAARGTPARPSTARRSAADTAQLGAPPAAYEMRVTGYVLDALELSQFVRAMQESKSYQRVDLIRSASAAVSGHTVVEFELTCRN